MITRRLFNAGLVSTTILPPLNLGRLISNDVEVGCYSFWAMNILNVPHYSKLSESPEATINIFKVGFYTDEEKTAEKIKYLDFIKKTEKIDPNLKPAKSLFYSIASKQTWGWALHEDYLRCAGVEYIDIKILDRNTKKPITFNLNKNLVSQRFDIEINANQFFYSTKDLGIANIMETRHILEDYMLSSIFSIDDIKDDFR